MYLWNYNINFTLSKYDLVLSKYNLVLIVENAIADKVIIPQKIRISPSANFLLSTDKSSCKIKNELHSENKDLYACCAFFFVCM